MIATNHKCQITQQSLFDKRISLSLLKSRTKTTRANAIRRMAKLFHFRVQLQKKRPEIPGQCNDQCHTY